MNHHSDQYQPDIRLVYYVKGGIIVSERSSVVVRLRIDKNKIEYFEKIFHDRRIVLVFLQNLLNEVLEKIMEGGGEE